MQFASLKLLGPTVASRASDMPKNYFVEFCHCESVNIYVFGNRVARLLKPRLTGKSESS